MNTPTITTPTLGVCTPSPKFGTPTGLIMTYRGLSADEFESFQAASIELGLFRRKRQLLELVHLNHQSYKDVMAELTSKFIADPAVTFDRANDIVVRINCELLNLLSAVRTFVDHAETALKREYGKDSQQVTDFKLAASREFDGNFSYRFMSQLRNFTQHCGLPLGELSLNANSNPPSSDVASASLQALFLRDYLLNNFDGWKMVKDELAKMPEKFPVDPHVEQVVASVARIDDILVRIQSADLDRHLKLLEALAKEVEHLPGSPCVYTSIIPKPGGANTNFQRIHLAVMRSVQEQLAQVRSAN
jgi:hypothetical protein